MELSKIAKSISPSLTLALTAKAAQMRAEGRDVISLSAGELDFMPPEEARKAAEDAIEKGLIKYTSSYGLPSLREEVANYINRRYGTSLSRENIIITPGAKYALFAAMLALLDIGHEVLIPIPYWVSYPEMVKLAGGKPVFVQTRPEDGFRLDPENIGASVTSKTKIFILNNPVNPTGVVYGKSEVQKIIDSLPESTVILSDEIYESLVLEGEFSSLLQLGEDLFERAIVVSGVSKSFAMTGWRLGWAVGKPEVISAIAKIQAHQTSNPCTVSQYATIAALKHCREFAEELKPVIKRRRDLALELLSDIKGFKPLKPNGAFYIYCDVRDLLSDEIPSSMALADFLLEKANVATVPGEAFGTPGFLRISIAESEERIAEAARRIKKALQREV